MNTNKIIFEKSPNFSLNYNLNKKALKAAMGMIICLKKKGFVRNFGLTFEQTNGKNFKSLGKKNLSCNAKNFFNFLIKFFECFFQNTSTKNTHIYDSTFLVNKNKIKKTSKEQPTDFIKFSIQSSIKIVKQEIRKIIEIDQKLGFFEMGLNSLDFIQKKIKVRIKKLKKHKIVILSKNCNLGILIFLFIFILLINYFSYFAIYFL